MKQNFADKHLFEIIIILKNSTYIYMYPLNSLNVKIKYRMSHLIYNLLKFYSILKFFKN